MEFTGAQVAKAAGISSDTLRNWRRFGHLPRDRYNSAPAILGVLLLSVLRGLGPRVSFGAGILPKIMEVGTNGVLIYSPNADDVVVVGTDSPEADMMQVFEQGGVAVIIYLPISDLRRKANTMVGLSRC